LLVPHSRHPYHINERVLFLYLGNALFAIFLSQKDIFDGAWGKSRWPSDNVSIQRGFWHMAGLIVLRVVLGILRGTIIKASQEECVLAVSVVRGAPWCGLQFRILDLPKADCRGFDQAYVWSIPVCCLFLGGSVTRLGQLTVVFPSTRPFIAQLARNKSLVGWTMPFRLLSLHYATAVLLRLPAIVFDISATQVSRMTDLSFRKGR
jgi:hypothetical protein